ncbi:hypothetical protein BTM25_05970 [Actinomadura rubteroloni]|uniref:Secreted protein n=1 Tax=Actinomadura rubteroloni TaxID=1926885 RepID=A0A2P4UMD7_9ACTN|nr:hypothetical protein [Actinomadura rubteroloni]POM26208.1 hypothetical protein BTM25_05970 [Actinomadura rubteroloni]
MNTATRLGAYGAGLAAVFAAALGAGALTGPVGATDEKGGASHMRHETTHETGHGTGHDVLPGGLLAEQDGYTLRPATTSVPARRTTDFRFTVTGPDGAPVTRYTRLHGKELHFIIVRRDLSGYQHLHPVRDARGVWSVPLAAGDPGTYRIFTDVRPATAKEQVTLGTDLDVPGDFGPRPLPPAERVAEVDGYRVKLAGDLVPGKPSPLTLTVEKDGRPVTDLEPYLEAYGHLVAIRAGDLAYLHVHPMGEPGDGTTRPGPSIEFHAEVPGGGTYRLFLDFQHAGKVRTAEFTVTAR